MNQVVFSNNLRNIRESLSVSQAQIAYDLKIDRKTIGRIERGETYPTLDFAYRVSVYLDHLIPEVFPLLANPDIPTFRQSNYLSERR